VRTCCVLLHSHYRILATITLLPDLSRRENNSQRESDESASSNRSPFGKEVRESQDGADLVHSEMIGANRRRAQIRSAIDKENFVASHGPSLVRNPIARADQQFFRRPAPGVSFDARMRQMLLVELTPGFPKYSHLPSCDLKAA
jgi:hypothetical protein